MHEQLVKVVHEQEKNNASHMSIRSVRQAAEGLDSKFKSCSRVTKYLKRDFGMNY
jgi:hypothetical protein